MSILGDWFWYVEKPTEIFVDIDCPDASTEDVSIVRSNKLFFAVRRIEAADALYQKKQEPGYGLNIANYAIYPSTTRRHYHLMIVLRQPLSFASRLGWRGRLMDDPYRLAQDSARAVRGVTGSLLISPEHHASYYRASDRVCKCQGKHTPEIMRTCPVARELRAHEAAEDYMGHPTAPPKDAPPLRFGMQR